MITMTLSPELPPLLGESAAFLELTERTSLAAVQERPVLIIGERGTGKELIAHRLHFESRRWQGTFVQLNCAALPETLLETELFGHEAGAFTGADKRRAGRFELADGGTLFLDEIASATLKAQEKILRAIEYGRFERIGGNQTLQVDVRVIGATNADLPSEADAGRFRHDLLDRLSFDVLTIPQLRHRGNDIALLAFHFGRAMAGELDWDGFPGFTKAAAAALADYPWPGNVRELRNVVERAVYLHGDPHTPIQEIQFDPFASPYRPVPPLAAGAAPARAPIIGTETIHAHTAIDLDDTVAALERRLLGEALEANRHSQKLAAGHLGLGYHQFRNRLKKHGLIG
jgi:psp operon transcriptional activator